MSEFAVANSQHSVTNPGSGSTSGFDPSLVHAQVASAVNILSTSTPNDKPRPTEMQQAAAMTTVSTSSAQLQVDYAAKEPTLTTALEKLATTISTAKQMHTPGTDAEKLDTLSEKATVEKNIFKNSLHASSISYTVSSSNRNNTTASTIRSNIIDTVLVESPLITDDYSLRVPKDTNKCDDMDDDDDDFINPNKYTYQANLSPRMKERNKSFTSPISYNDNDAITMLKDDEDQQTLIPGTLQASRSITWGKGTVFNDARYDRGELPRKRRHKKKISSDANDRFNEYYNNNRKGNNGSDGKDSSDVSKSSNNELSIFSSTVGISESSIFCLSSVKRVNSDIFIDYNSKITSRGSLDLFQSSIGLDCSSGSLNNNTNASSSSPTKSDEIISPIYYDATRATTVVLPHNKNNDENINNNLNLASANEICNELSSFGQQCYITNTNTNISNQFGGISLGPTQLCSTSSSPILYSVKSQTNKNNNTSELKRESRSEYSLVVDQPKSRLRSKSSSRFVVSNVAAKANKTAL